MTQENLDWLHAGKGISPSLRWSFGTDAPLVCFQTARETGDIFAADSSGGIYRLDRLGRIKSLTRGLKDIRALAWSDTGQFGIVQVGESSLCQFNQKMEVEWTLDQEDPILSVAVSPFGRHVALGLANGKTVILNSRKRHVADFETIRPLRFLQFLVTEPTIIGAAEYGLLCSYDVDGKQLFSEKIWGNIGDLSASGDGNTIMLAAFNLGIQAYDGGGANRASYIVEGTAKNVSTSFTGDRVVVATLERHLYWTDSDGELLWATRTEEEIHGVICDPLGEWIVCGFESGRLIRLDWDSPA